jgi:hypothetical protein
MKQSPADLIKHLEEQFKFMQASAKMYDEGSVAESKRLACSIRVLVHDTGMSKSLMDQLKMKDNLFLDTASPWNPKNFMSHQGLLSLHLGEGSAIYKPRLDDGPPILAPWIPFNSWWNNIILVDNERRQLSRKQLVLAIANKDGGAHVDPILGEEYGPIRNNISMAWCTQKDGVEVPLEPRVNLASVRQISHEVLRTIERIVNDQ